MNSYIKIIIVKIDIFESYVLEERHFAKDDISGMLGYKLSFEDKEDLVVLTVEMG